jgi:predicted Fe-Mo cluster-binding NifX family protein
MKPILFAFGLSNENIFTTDFFGAADKFVIYEFSEGKSTKKEELPNPFHNSSNKLNINEKREIIVSLLQSRNVSVLVSRQFSKNLRLVNDHFIPVLIEMENPEQVIEILKKNIKWIKDELKSRKSGHMLFRIKTGVLKLAIN